MGFSGKVLSEAGHSEEFTCAICMTLVDLDQSVLTSCNHCFCWSCLSEWLQKKRSCPTCQKDLSLVTSSSVPYLKTGSPIAYRVLARVRVQCPLCAWSGDYSELQSHLVSSSEHTGEQTQASREATALLLKEQGNAQYQAQSFDAALRLYTKAISTCDSLPVLYTNRAAVHFTTGNYELALADADRAERLAPGNAAAGVRAAKALVRLGRFPEALARLEGKDGVDGERASVVALAQDMEAAQEAVTAGEFKLARQHTGRLLLLSTAAPVLLLAARVEAEAGSTERALKLALQLLRQDRANPAAYCVRARAVLYAGDAEEANKLVREALRLSPDDAEALRVHRLVKAVRAGLAMGEKCAKLKDKDYAGAAAAYSDLLALAALPVRCVLRAEVLANRANAWFRLEQFSKALKDVADALYMQADNKRAILTRAYVRHAQDMHEEALKDLEPLMERWGQADAVIKGAYENAQFLVRKQRRPDYYKLLSGADPTNPHLSSLSSEVELKQAYKRQAMIWHPDRVEGDEAKAKAEAHFKLVGEALEVLTDSFKRKLFDEGFDKEAIEERVKRASSHAQQHSHQH